MSQVEMRLELFAVPVTDVDRAKDFYVNNAGSTPTTITW